MTALPPVTRARHALVALLRPLGRRPVLLTLGFLALYLATYDSRLGSPDENQRFDLAVAMAKDGVSALRGSGKRSKYPPLQSLLAVPLVRLGLRLDPKGQERKEGSWTYHLGVSLNLLAAVALIPLFFGAARLLDVPPGPASVATLLFGLSSPIWPYSKRFFSEPLTALLALGAFVGVLAYLRRDRRVGLALGLGCLALMPLQNMVVPLAIGTCLGAMLLWERRWRALALLALATVAAYLLLKWSLAIRFDGAASTGYDNEKFTFEWREGIRGLTLGWGRSVFLFAPLLVASVVGIPALWRTSRGVCLGVFAALLVQLVVIANWWAWAGGICWGPRLVLPVLPLATVGVGPLLARPRAWKAALTTLLTAAGLWVQFLGFSFKHDFDIYFWMKHYGQDEKKAWFEWEYSVLRRMPRHFREHPWDLASAFLHLEQTGDSTVTIDRRPVQEVRIEHAGDALVYWWSIADIWCVLDGPNGGRRLPAAQLGARLVTWTHRRDAPAALDGDPSTRWTSRSKRLDGHWVRLIFPSPRTDVVRLDVGHLPYETDFPNGLRASIRAGPRAPWEPVPAHAATPILRWHWLIFALSGGGILILALAFWVPAAPPGPGARTARVQGERSHPRRQTNATSPAAASAIKPSANG